MALYEFICEKCGNKEEKLITMSKRNEPQNCKCGNNMSRLISRGAGFKFIGEGFYHNDVFMKKDLKKLAQKEKKWRKENVD